jgi:hypothetical protein
VPGFPIRTPSDQRSVDSSPRTIAASHVLHRLLVPRHPPCALDNLTNTHIKKSRHKCAQKQKMLASTVQFSTTTRTSTHNPTPGEGALTVPKKTTRPEDRNVVLSGPNSVPTPPTKQSAGTSGVSTFLEQPHSHDPDQQVRARYSGPSTTPRERAGHSPTNNPGKTVFGEAP